MNKIDYICDNCNKPITVYKRYSDKLKHHFCNRLCYHTWLHKSSPKFEYPCDYCNTKLLLNSFDYNASKTHFCNEEHYHMWLKENAPKGVDNQNWRGGTHKTTDGYIRVNTPEGIRFAEHRLVMEKSLGRKLSKDELVHHLNGVRHDNREENLAVVDKCSHEKRTVEKLQANRIQKLEYQLSHIYGCPN